MGRTPFVGPSDRFNVPFVPDPKPIRYMDGLTGQPFMGPPPPKALAGGGRRDLLRSPRLASSYLPSYPYHGSPIPVPRSPPMIPARLLHQRGGPVRFAFGDDPRDVIVTGGPPCIPAYRVRGGTYEGDAGRGVGSW